MSQNVTRPQAAPKLEDSQIMKHNNIIRAGYSLSLAELRLVSLVVLYLEPSRLDYDIRAEDYSERFGLHKSNAYRDLQQAADHLFERRFMDYTTDNKPRKMRWVQTIIYNENQGSVSLKIAEDFMQYLVQLRANFTILDFEEMKSLSSIYSLRMYEILRSYEFLKTFTLTVEDIRKMFELSPEYSQNNIQEKILKPATRKIFHTTGLQAIYSVVKEGRKVTGYRFEVQQRSKPKSTIKKPPIAGLSGIELDFYKKAKALHPELTQEQVIATGNPFEYLKGILGA